MLVEIYRFRSPPLQKRIDVAHRVQRENTNTGRSKHYRGFYIYKRQSFWFFVKFWGAKVSMHSWRGHALNTVRVLFRCVC